jgi:hypothetical protein
MLSISDYLLTKLNEECIELTDAVIKLRDNQSDQNIQELSDELNDVHGVVGMVLECKSIPSSDLVRGSNLIGVNDDFSKYIKDVDSLPYRHLLSEISTQSLATAKMACKCLVFGLSETKVGSSLHNTSRLVVEITKLFIVTNRISNEHPEIRLCDTKQELKRQKMLKYLAVSKEQGVVDEDCFNEFSNIATRMRRRAA